MTSVPKAHSSRHLARRSAMQAIYQWQHTQCISSEIIQQFMEDDLLLKVDYAYFTELLDGVINHCVEIDESISAHLDRPLQQLNPVELAVMRVAVFELHYKLEVPYRVVINEALEIAKEFGAEQGHKYVNAILDQLAPKLRAHEKK